MHLGRVTGTVVAFILYLYVLGHWKASAASYTFVLVPIVTVILASILTDETIPLIFLVGAMVVLAGVYVGALMPGRKDPDAAGEGGPARPGIEKVQSP